MFKKIIFVIVSLSFILTACASPTALSDQMMDEATEVMQKPTEAMMDAPTEEMTLHETATTDAMPTQADPATPEAMMEDKMIEPPAWFDVTLSNVRSGENFTLNDFMGKVVLVENLAMWCSNCKKQQMEVKALAEALMLDMGTDLVLIGLDIDPNENADDLRSYTDANGFDWIYAIAPLEVAREIGNLYGDQFLNPPSTPILVIDRTGQVHPTPFGIKSADDLMRFVEPFLNEGT
jgi:thiol-disulfide isomerase/thioredoxin